MSNVLETLSNFERILLDFLLGMAGLFAGYLIPKVFFYTLKLIIRYIFRIKRLPKDCDTFEPFTFKYKNIVKYMYIPTTTQWNKKLNEKYIITETSLEFIELSLQACIWAYVFWILVSSIVLNRGDQSFIRIGILGIFWAFCQNTLIAPILAGLSLKIKKDIGINYIINYNGNWMRILEIGLFRIRMENVDKYMEALIDNLDKNNYDSISRSILKVKDHMNDKSVDLGKRKNMKYITEKSMLNSQFLLNPWENFILQNEIFN